MRTARQTDRASRSAVPPATLTFAAAALLAIALASLAGGAEAKQGSRSGAHHVLYYVQHAKRGSFEHVHRHHYVLTLGGVPHRIAAHAGRDRKPHKGKLATARFVGEWHRHGFDRIRPRALLLVPKAPARRALVRLRLGEPSYSSQAKTIRYPVRVNANDRARRRFGRARLTIDGHSGVAAECVIGPFAQCSGADLRGRDLSRRNLLAADFTRANLTAANLSSADISYAKLSYADLSSAKLNGAKLETANLGSANLTGAELYSANLIGAFLTAANLSRASLGSADLTGAKLYDANLAGASLIGAKLTNALFCHTTMPDRSTNDSGCLRKRTR